MTKARDLADFLGDNTSLSTINNAYDAGTLVPSSTNPSLIINGDMLINQRNTVFTNPNGVFPVDRFGVEQYVSTTTTEQSTTAPSGYSNSLKVTNGNAYTPTNANFTYRVYQNIEGYNTAPLLFGYSSAKTVTISFWVRSSLTGTFGVALQNSAQDRSYVSTYTISQADTFEQKTITITGDVAGTWIGATNGVGLRLIFDLGSRANRETTAGSWQSGNYSRTSGCVELNATTSATFYVTGVKLEEGSEATDFQHTSYAEELAKCYRYYFRSQDADYFIESFYVETDQTHYGTKIHPVTMRANPTITLLNVDLHRFSSMNVFRNYKTRWGWSAGGISQGRGYVQFEYTADAEI